MKIFKSISTVIFLALSIIANGQKKMIAIAPFQVPQDLEYRYDFRGTGLIDKIPSLLEAELSTSEKFTLFEREQLDKVVDEQILSNSGLTENTIEFGKLKGVDYFILGKITGFSAEVDNVELKLGLRNMYVCNQNIKLKITVKLVNVTTGQLVKVITKEAEVKDKGKPRGNPNEHVDSSNIDKAASLVSKMMADALIELL